MWRPEEGVQVPEVRVIGSCELLDMGAENGNWVLGESSGCS